MYPVTCSGLTVLLRLRISTPAPARRAKNSRSWRKGRPDLAEELADSAIFLFGLAEMVGADLEDAVAAKLAKNQAGPTADCPAGSWSRKQLTRRRARERGGHHGMARVVSTVTTAAWADSQANTSR